MQKLQIKVPASTANLGPGFDSIALALGLYNTVDVMTTDQQETTIEIHGEGEHNIPRNERNAFIEGMKAVYERTNQQLPGLHLRLHIQIPIAAGLGSSASAYTAGIAAANSLLRESLSREEMFKLATELEGHPDNAAAAVFGGLTASSHGACGLLTRQLPTAEGIKVVVVLPAMHLDTAAQRTLLPQEVALEDAASNIGRAVLVAQALATGDYKLLAEAMCDRLHEPFRIPVIPGGEAAIKAAHELGAAAALSGSGPALVAFSEDQHDNIRDAMIEAFRDANLAARSWTLPVDYDGVSVKRIQEE